VAFKTPTTRNEKLSDYDILTDDLQNDWALHTENDVEITLGEFDVFCHPTIIEKWTWLTADV
jgi:hypothetical protein